MIRSIQFLILFTSLVFACNVKQQNALDVAVTRTWTDKPLYTPGEKVTLEKFRVINKGQEQAVVDSLFICVGTSESGGEVQKVKQLVNANLILNQGQGVFFQPVEIINSVELESGAYLINVELIAGETKVSEYLTFFRVDEQSDQLSFQIDRDNLGKLPIYSLRGGLSAEYAVQKAISSLTSGISHSWNVPEPGMGPKPIPPTPDFLQRSAQKTVDIYNNYLGESTPIETVIIGTGIPSTQYLSRALNAPVLPIHFLIGVHTIKEVQTVLDRCIADDIKAYATIGHDYSLSMTQSVAWIKLLSLPHVYQQFLIDHKVQQVVFHGALGKGGESGARKFRDDTKHYGAGSIYLMHFAGDQSEKYLGETIRDFDTTKLEPFQFIADWEAGIIMNQVQDIANEIKESTSIDATLMVTTDDAIHLWNMGTYLMLHLLKKNDLSLKGISLNPYLIGHPVFETTKGLVPFLYWQGFNPQFHINNRLNTVIKESIEHYYPVVTMQDLTYWVNSTNNFGGLEQGLEMSSVLKQNGLSKVVDNDYQSAEVWFPQDGINSAVEVRAQILNATDVTNLNQKLTFLTLTDIEYISKTFNGIQVLSL